MPQPINYKRIDIPVDPLVFRDVFNGIVLAIPHPDAVWAQWGDTTVKMDIWFTERGQHSIIWDEEGNNGER